MVSADHFLAQRDLLRTTVGVRTSSIVLNCVELLMLALRPDLRTWQPQPASPQSHTNKARLRSTGRLMQRLQQLG